MVSSTPPISIIFPSNDRETLDFAGFADAFNKRWDRCPHMTDLIDECKEQSIARVVWGVFGPGSLRWLSEPLVVLEGNTPRDVLQFPEGRTAIKGLLLESDLVRAAVSPYLVRPIKQRITPIARLCRVDVLARNSEWVERFLGGVPKAELFVHDDAPYRIIEGLEALAIYSEPLKLGQTLSRQTFSDLLRRAIDRGHGLVLNPNKRFPDWTFTYGDLLEFRLTGVIPKRQSHELEHERSLIGPYSFAGMRFPSVQTLPRESIPVVRRFMRGTLNVRNPMVCEVLTPIAGGTRSILGFNVAREFYRTDDEFLLAIRNLGWLVRSTVEVRGVSLLNQRHIPLVSL